MSINCINVKKLGFAVCIQMVSRQANLNESENVNNY